MESSGSSSRGPVVSTPATGAGRRGLEGKVALLAAFLFALALLACVLWLVRSRDEEAPARAAGGRPSEAPLESGAPPLPAGLAREPVAAPGARGPAGPLAGAGVRTEERGSIRGTIHPPAGQPLPRAWTALVEPSELYDTGAVPTRRLEIEDGRDSFVLSDLPLGGYRVRALTAAWNSLPVHVLLAPGSTKQVVLLPLSPTGFVDGSVLDAAGRPAEGVELVLERASDGTRASAVTAADGTFLFREVHDGEHRLYVGPPEAPLLPPRELSFAAPSLRVPRLELPPLATLVAWTLDRVGDPLPDVVLEGFGRKGGNLRASSDGRGRVEARWLVPGKWSLSAESPDGRSGRADLELLPERVTEVELRVLAR